MLKQTAELLVRSARNIGVELDHREGYIGRSSGSSTTDAVVAKLRDFVAAVAEAAINIDEGDTNYGHAEFVEEMKSIVHDNMGKESVFY